MTSLIYYGLTLIRFYGQGGRSRISIKLDSHTLLALFSCPPLVFGVGLKKTKMFFSPQCLYFGTQLTQKLSNLSDFAETKMKKTTKQ